MKGRLTLPIVCIYLFFSNLVVLEKEAFNDRREMLNILEIYVFNNKEGIDMYMGYHPASSVVIFLI